MAGSHAFYIDPRDKVHDGATWHLVKNALCSHCGG